MKTPLWLLLGALATFTSFAAPPPELPLETFFADPQASQLQLSPDGRYFVFLTPVHNRMQIVVVDRKANKRQRITDMKEESVVSVSWIKNSRLLFRQQVKGQESYGTYAVNADGTNLRILQQATVRDGEKLANRDDRRGFTIVHELPRDPDNILVSVARGNSGLGDIYKLNVHNERRTLVETNPGKVRDWIADHHGVPRIAVDEDENESYSTWLYRPDTKTDWKEVLRATGDAAGMRPLAFDGDNQTLIVLSDLDRATRGLFTYDIAQSRITGTLVDDPRYDLNDYQGAVGLIYSTKKHRYVGVSYEAEKRRTIWFDPEFKRMQASIDAVLPDTLNVVQNFTRDEKEFIILAASDRDPGTFYLFNPEAGTLEALARRLPQVDPAQMAESRPFSFTARDGMTLFGYLTIPNGRELKRLPMIINPHGGPYGPRDIWRFNSELQFLANRGYLVLQVNFRGSGGYGRAYEEAGYRQWGLAMQDDLTDAVKWAVAQGYADPDRVAIYGASYGGYATLAGLAFTPELYACGVNYVGASDIERLGFMRSFDYLPKPAQDYMARRWLHPLKDAKQIHDTSPVNFVQNFRVPLLMAYGEYDPRVTIDHGQVLEAALKKYNKPYQNIVIENEGHGFGKFENKLSFYRAMEKFLEENLKVRRGKVQPGQLRVTEMPAKTD